MNLFLKEPQIENKQEVIKMCKEIETCSDEYPFEGASRLKQLLNTTYDEWLKMCESDKTIELTNPNWSNGTNYLLVDENNHVYGYSQLRHSLKGQLINIGGNIGYIIRPTERKKGYATIQLKLLLDKAHDLGIERVLVTCRDNNIGSRKTIEKCLGEQDTSVPSQYPNITELRYWISTRQIKKEK